MITNFDEDLLVGLRVDPNYDEPILHQVLRIAVYDEFHAYEVYSKVIGIFGAKEPFVNIVEAEKRHYSALIPLLEKYGVPVPINNWAPKIEIPKTFVECCEVGVAAEIDNVMMYDNLLKYTTEPDIKDVLFKLQAASYNNHLLAFRKCVANKSGDVDLQSIYEQFSSHNMDDAFNNIGDLQQLAASFAGGNANPAAILKLLDNYGGSMIGGALIGGLAIALMSQLNDKKE